jgi:hypothetical protein
MSAEHVRMMNEKLGAAPKVLEACSRLASDALIAWRFEDEDTGEVIWWQMLFSRESGIRFALGEPSAPAGVTFASGYWAFVEHAFAKGEKPALEMETLGDAGLIQVTKEAFEAALAVAAVPIERPVRTRGREVAGSKQA